MPAPSQDKGKTMGKKKGKKVGMGTTPAKKAAFEAMVASATPVKVKTSHLSQV